MISKDTFVKIMTRLEDLDKKMDNVDTALKALSSDFCGFYLPEVYDISIELLKHIFKDKEDWIGYFVFELNWLHDHTLGSVSVDGNDIDLSDWDKVYDFLIKNMED